MSKLLIRIIIITIIAAVGWGVYRSFATPRAQEVQARLVAQPPSAEGFAQADGPRPLSFPADFGSHPDFQTEWWYYTGNLDSSSGKHYGYQLTFFRRSLLPPSQVPARKSEWATDQVYMAHFALTDVSQGRFQSYERLQRGAAGLAGARVDPWLNVWLEDWSIQQESANTFHLHAEQAGIVLDLTLDDTKGIILQGDQGYSRKGPQAGNASIYFSQTHLVTSGSISIDGSQEIVTGLSWMDHEFSTSALSRGQVGWDWFALQLSDGSELMVFNIRQADGSPDPYSSGTFIAKDGTTKHLTREDFSLSSEITWTSSYSGANYPAKWKVDVPSLGISLQIEPYLADQENRLSFTYWEGAVHMSGSHAGSSVTGEGYVELTGYSGSMGGQF